jgi:Uma2 family endonuclease
MQEQITAQESRPARWRFTTEEYHRMGEVGIFHEDDRVELIAGELIRMAAIGPRHAANVDRINDLFMARLERRAIVRVQNPVQLAAHSEPEPDIVLLRRRADYYATGHPQPEDVLLIVEVADTSLGYDRDTKVPLYAAAGIPEVWIADLQGDRLRVFRDPDAGEYRRVEVLTRNDSVAPLAFPDLLFSVDELLS